VTDDRVELSGSTSPDDLSLLFQVIYLAFTAPRQDSTAFRRLAERHLAIARRRSLNPDAIFEDSLASAVTQHHPHALRAARPIIDSVDMHSALAFWRARTANASNFTLVLTGDLTLGTVRDLAGRYLAPLPGGAREQPRDRGIRFPSRVVHRVFRAGEGPKARTSIVLSGPFDHSDRSSEALGMARDLAELALETRLRETLGATYGVSVGASADVAPPQSYFLTIEFEGAPEGMDSLARTALAELERLRTKGPTDAEVRIVRERKVRDLDDREDDNDYWANELSWHTRIGLPLSSIPSHQSHARSIDAKGLRSAAASYLRTDRYVRVTMLPRRRGRPAVDEPPSGGRGRLDAR
jgi:zinc protease